MDNIQEIIKEMKFLISVGDECYLPDLLVNLEQELSKNKDSEMLDMLKHIKEKTDVTNKWMFDLVKTKI